MIFSVIGENFGFIGGVLLILLYLLLIYLMIRVTFDTKNEFYAYISTGVIMMILFHVFENIGMNIGLLPLTGIPLPFISAGGSSLIGNLIGIGMVMSIDHQARDLVAVGLNKSALQELGQLNFIDVALVGTQLKTNDSLATIEGQKMIVDLKSPLDGVIVAVNPALEGWVAADSDDGQWLIKVQPFS